jgi:hypothetical protein
MARLAEVHAELRGAMAMYSRIDDIIAMHHDASTRLYFNP